MMQPDQTLCWICRNPKRQRFVTHLIQPITARQLSRVSDQPLGSCSYLLWELATHCILTCLNTSSRRSRLYWLTRLGQVTQRTLREEAGLEEAEYDFPLVDWTLYGWVCFTHREAIIRAMDQPMQPSEIKRRAISRNPTLRMSANNVRDVMRLFLAKGIIQSIRIRKKKHLRYELTPTGQQLRTLLQGAYNMSWY